MSTANVPTDTLSAYRLWVMSYKPAPPKLPKGWARWTFWQWTEGSHNAPVQIDGVGPSDQNVFNGSIDELRRL